MDFQTLERLVAAPGQQPDFKGCVEAIPALTRLASTPQEPAYHGEGDVWTHTCMVVEAMVGGSAYERASAEERFVLFYSALLHDIAKPDTTVIDEVTGRIGQPGHSRRGSIDARILLWKAGVPFSLRETICRIISVHQVPFWALSGDRSGHSPEFLAHRLSWELPLWMLIAMAIADMEGRIYPNKQHVLDDIVLFQQLAEEESCLYSAKAFPDDYTRMSYFRGARIHPAFCHYREQEGSDVVVMAGLPASGKNTWVAENLSRLPVVSYDDARDALGLAHGKNEGAVAHYAVDTAKALLRKKEAFVWNATHLSGQMRKKTLDLLYQYNASIRIVYLEQPERVILQRNARRNTSLRNQDIQRMLCRWEVPLPSEADCVEYLA
ncbi:AAA family ATPase [Pseudomonas sp.]|uniref:AAA family ATPase n=1 Tax=Pseudomonas sp. TaxID=306 RepID=UPI00289BCECB|nr:AAA family ATPase [Pseudomonas sp.]